MKVFDSELNDVINVRTLNELRDEATRIATEHGFTDATPLEEIALIHSELSEALEDIRVGQPMTETYYENVVGPGPLKPCGVPTEMADALIRILDFCGKRGIDIEKAVEEKMRFNESRPYKHRKKI